jgi:hypothetical protein
MAKDIGVGGKAPIQDEKIVLIKACAQAIPTFVMSCFDITIALREHMGAIICRFWWAKHDKQNTMHMLSSETLIKPKKEGGLVQGPVRVQYHHASVSGLEGS